MLLTQKGESERVQLLSNNIALSRFLRELVSRRKLERGSITVSQWEELAHHLLTTCSMENEAPAAADRREEKRRYYDQDLPALLLECVREAEFADRLPRFDALVVDEAQDHDTAFPDSIHEGDSTDGLGCGWWSLFCPAA